jgi:radical SAM protein with 4Fe4S-binding SPASM domain
MLAEQIKLMMQIHNHRQKSLEEREREATRILDKTTCEKCPFAELCYGELRGGQMQTMIDVDFKENSYAKKYKKEYSE